MDKVRYLLYILIQCTWGAMQTLLGLILFIRFKNCEHSFYHGCIKTDYNSSYSVSLGVFIFVSNKYEHEESKRITLHEYGHTIQSLILGPLYLIVIGLTSFAWCRLPYFQKMREEKNMSYYSLWVEKWANKLGEKFMGKEYAIQK